MEKKIELEQSHIAATYSGDVGRKLYLVLSQITLTAKGVGKERPKPKIMSFMFPHFSHVRTISAIISYDG